MNYMNLTPWLRVDGQLTPNGWADFTDARLRWLYGHDHAETRKAMTDADLASWRALGSKKPCR